MKELTQDKYKCYGAAGADKCGASLDAVKGKLDGKMLELFADLLEDGRRGQAELPLLRRLQGRHGRSDPTQVGSTATRPSHPRP